MSGNLRSWGNKSGYRYCDRIYGFSSDGGNHCKRRKTLLGKDSAFQEVDIAGIVMPITKHSFIVKNIHELADTLIRKAFYIAKSGRPGPVLVDVTKDVTANEI